MTAIVISFLSLSISIYLANYNTKKFPKNRLLGNFYLRVISIIDSIEQDIMDINEDKIKKDYMERKIASKLKRVRFLIQNMDEIRGKNKKLNFANDHGGISTSMMKLETMLSVNSELFDANQFLNCFLDLQCNVESISKEYSISL